MVSFRHSSDEEPGFTRVRRGKGFSYYDPDGDLVEDKAVRERLNALAVPPAYKDVWYCPDENGHVQATGIDDKGRKQYRYHDDFRAAAEAEKFDRCADFGHALPKIRGRVNKDLRRRKLQRDAVLAAIVRLLDIEHLRIGNRQYAKSNKSFGATTLKRRHVEALKTRIKINFRGKHGIERDVTITDAGLQRIVRECHELPGQQLFQYLDKKGVARGVDSSDVNDYLKDASGGDFTAKHFRTWGASVLAMREIEQQHKMGERLTLKSVVEPVAEALGNTPAVTRSSYIHPALLEEVKDNPDAPFADHDLPTRKRKCLSLEEVRLLAFLSPDGVKKSKRRRIKEFIRIKRRKG